MRPAVMRRSLGVLVCLLLAAHSLRLGDFGLSGAWLGLGGLVLTRQAWVRWVVAAACLWGVWIWGTTTVELVQFRLALGAPWARLAGILGTVFTVTAATGWLFVHSSAERISPRHRSQQRPWLRSFCSLWSCSPWLGAARRFPYYWRTGSGPARGGWKSWCLGSMRFGPGPNFSIPNSGSSGGHGFGAFFLWFFSPNSLWDSLAWNSFL